MIKRLPSLAPVLAPATVILMLLLAACAGVKPTTGPSLDRQIAAAQQAYNQGDFAVAARRYLDVAKQAQPPQRQDLQLHAADALIRAEDLSRAQQVVAQVPPATDDPILLLRVRLLSARIALAQRHGEAAIKVLGGAPPKDAKPSLKAEYHGLRADAFALQGNHLETAHELVKREPFLTAPQAVETNQQEIWKALAMLTPRALHQLRTQPPPDVLSGWMALVEIAKTYQLQPEQLKAHLADWRAKYPNHPVLQKILDALLGRRREEVAYPDRIALLLPFSSKFAEAADALRDGFLAAYYTHHPSDKQVVRIYDVGNNPADVLNVYHQAVQDGAQFIVGPLDKDAVNVLAHQDKLAVPTLALNYSVDLSQYPPNLYQFSLSPEDEAHQTAQRTWLDGYVNGATLTPVGNWGQRIYNAYSERWQQLGGHIVAHETYNPSESDFSGPIRHLLAIDQSRNRHRRLEIVLKRDIEFTPRRRQDIDFIFIAAHPREGRLIRPQLRFYHASRVPVYATAAVFSGTINQEMDRDMDGIIFGDMPWVLSQDSSHRGIRSEVEPYITPAGHNLPRLYALGIDAFNVIAALNPLSRYPYERFDGETGSLSVDANHRLRRQLTWVRFRSGRPVLLDPQQ